MTYPGRPAGWTPCDPWVTKGHAWAPTPADLRGTPQGTGGYWLVRRQGGHTSGGFRTRAAARAYIAGQSRAWIHADPGGAL
jgi:hypothetical protein